MSVLVVNSGSSSVKFELVDPDSGDSIAAGLVEHLALTVLEHVMKAHDHVLCDRLRHRFLGGSGGGRANIRVAQARGRTATSV